MAEICMNFAADGSIRAIYDDDLPLLDDLPHFPPKRASHVEAIQVGPNAGKWYVDMSPLGPDFVYCLWPAFKRRADALQAEHVHIAENWIKPAL